MNAYVDCIGCEQRQLDAQRVIDYLKANDITLVDEPAQSDYSILVTCAVDKTSEDASVARMRNLTLRMGPETRLIIGGCLPSISPHITRHGVYATFSPRSIESLDDVFKGKVKMVEIKGPNKSSFGATRSSISGKLSPREEYDQAKFGYKLVIDQGCLLSCTFCKIKDATGRLQSVPLDSLVNQFQQAVEQKEPTIMLLGGDTGAYGYDIGLRFHDLLERLSAIPGDYKVFIHDFNVNWLVRDEEGYMQAFAEDAEGKHFRGINFPVQSGSDRILNLMKRPHKAIDATSALRRIKRDYSHIKIGTHLIVGFPGEDENDFQDTLKLLDEVNFDFVSCFPYSEHETARSAVLPDKVDLRIINKRLEVVSRSLGDRVKIIR